MSMDGLDEPDKSNNLDVSRQKTLKLQYTLKMSNIYLLYFMHLLIQVSLRAKTGLWQTPTYLVFSLNPNIC